MAFAEKMKEARLDGMRTIELYTSLDDKQKKAFDTGGARRRLFRLVLQVGAPLSHRRGVGGEGTGRYPP